MEPLAIYVSGMGLGALITVAFCWLFDMFTPGIQVQVLVPRAAVRTDTDDQAGGAS